MQFLRTLLKGLAYVPRVVSTDKLASDGAALREILPSVEHRRHKGLHNRAEHAHQPTRERRMRRFKDPGHVRRFLAAYGPIASHFRPRRHRLTASLRLLKLSLPCQALAIRLAGRALGLRRRPRRAAASAPSVGSAKGGRARRPGGA